MRGMAGQAAFSIGDRSVRNGSLFALIGMTREAQFVAGSYKELCVLRNMGIMAGSAHTSLKRRMFNLATGLELGLVMALITELTIAHDGFERLV